ncbi:hypothetical protein Q3G72_006576 [Acer saccharum]|nr:hypothetical protein Q3G72_006576 [Acer saccharum]
MSETTKTFLLFSTTLFLLFTIYWFSPFHIYIPTKYEKISINQYDVLYKSSDKLLDYDVFDEKDVVVLSDQNFGHFVAKNRYVMVAFYAPRLYWSKKLVPEYAAAATQLKGSEVVLAKVDALRERRLANKYGVDGYPSLIFFVGGVDLERCYHRDREALVNYTKTKIALGVYTITTTQQAEGVLMAESTVAFLHSIKDCKELVAASKMHTDVIFYQSDSPDVAKIFQIDNPEINHSALVLVEKKSQQFNHFDGQFSKSAISEFVSMNKLPLVITFGTENAPSILNSPLKQLWLFDLTHDSKKVKSVFQEVAKAYKGKILFVYAERKRRDVGIGYDHPPRPRVSRPTTGSGQPAACPTTGDRHRPPPPRGPPPSMEPDAAINEPDRTPTVAGRTPAPPPPSTTTEIRTATIGPGSNGRTARRPPPPPKSPCGRRPPPSTADSVHHPRGPGPPGRPPPGPPPSTTAVSRHKSPEAFVFSAQPSPPAVISPNLSTDLDPCGSAKRARSELISYGRNDVVVNTSIKDGSKIPPQGGLKNRKKGTVVASTSRHVAKLKETRGVPFLDNSSRSNVHSKETGDNKDMDSASVLRHLHKEVHEFIAQPVDPMETVETTNGQKDYAHPVTGLDKSFDMVASDLKEAFAVISE